MNRWTRNTLAAFMATLTLAGSALAQFQNAPPMGTFAASPYEDYGAGNGGGYGPGYGPAGPMSGASKLVSPLPGPLAVGIHGAAEGLGYEGSYVFAHQVVPLTTDPLHGWWLLDARGALSENGNPFANIGIVRRAYFAPMGADVGIGVFYDYDADQYEDFGHDFQQIGVSGHVWTQYVDININGYIPVGETAHLVGTPNSPFFDNFLVVQLGIDSALEGFDIEVGLRPNFLAQHSGTIYFGGYSFQGEGIDPFGGFQTRFSLQPIAGLTLTAGLTTDNEFDTNALLQVEWNWGSNRGYSPSGRDLDPIRRNAHIVRANQTPILGSDPDTGLLYHVVHVDNSFGPNGDGTVERPFDTLAEAEVNSVPNNIIFVHAGLSTLADGSPGNLTGYSSGIVLQDGQFFLGEGVVHTIPTVEVGDFSFLAGTAGILPTITNPAGPAVTLADDNVVGGLGIVNAQVGVSGNGITDAEIRDNNIFDSVDGGIEIVNSTGEIDILRNFVDGSGDHGISVENTTGQLVVQDNTSTNNGIGVQSGLNVSLTGGNLIATIFGNTFDDNGVGMSVSASGAGSNLTAVINQNDSISDNLANGVAIDIRNGATSNFFVVGNTNISNNGQSSGTGTGIRISVFNATANGLVANNVLQDNIGTSAISPITSDAVMGIGASVYGLNGRLNLDITNNLISGSGLAAGQGGDAILLDFDTGNPVVSTINITNNRFTNPGINLVDINAENDSRAEINIIDNVALLATGSGVNRAGGVNASVTEDAVVQLTALRNNFSNMTGPLGESDFTLFAGGTGRLIAYIERNTMENNGGDAGLTVFARDSGTIALEFTNNRIVGGEGDGINLLIDDLFLANGNIYAIFSGNEVSLNGGDEFVAEISATGTNAADMHIAFRNQNVFGAFPVLFNNSTGDLPLPLSGFSDFRYETDGSSTPPAPIVGQPPVNQVPNGQINPIISNAQTFP